jgi:glycosyl transferase family 25
MVDTFGGVYYINLEHRKDRNDHIKAELDKMRLKYKRFNAIKHECGAVGCSRSHLEVLKLAKKQNLKNVLILEDDFEFLVNKQTFWNEIRTFYKKELDYDVLMLSYNIRKSTPFNNQLLKLLEVQTTSGYIVNQKFYDVLIKVLEDSIPLLESTRNEPIYAIDQIWKTVQPQNKWYAFKKRIGRQMKSYSDITKKVESYGV